MALQPNIVDYWKLDSSRNGGVSINISSVGGTPAYGAGIINNGIVYTATVGQYDRFSYTPGLNVGSVNIWFKIAGPGTGLAQRILGQTQVGVTDLIGFYVQRDGKGLTLALQDLQFWNDTFDRYVYGTWNMATITWNGTTVSGYSNGVNLFNTASTRVLNANLVDWTIGGWTGNNTQQVNGTIDEITIWSQALSAADVTALWNGGTGVQAPYTNLNKSGFFNLM